MITINWQRKPKHFWCSACRKWVDDSRVSGDQTHERARGGCGEFVLDERDVRAHKQNTNPLANRA